MKTVAAVGLLLLTLAGCADPEPDVPGPDPPMPLPSVPIGTYLLEGSCAPNSQACHEPTAAFAADGSLMVTTHTRGDVFLVGTDGTVANVPAPDAGGDALLQSDPLRRIHHTVLSGGGIAWAVLANGNWTESRMYLHPGALPSQFLDRQWLAFRADGSGYLVYSLAGTAVNGIWAAPFDTDRQFGAPVQLASTDERRAVGVAGMPAIDGEGRLIVPMHAALRPQVAVPVAENVASYTSVLVAILEPGSARVLQTIHAAPVGDALERWPMATTQDGVAVVVWAQKSGGLLLSQREPDGSWTGPRHVNAGRPAATLPYVMQGPEAPVVVWYEEAGGPRVRKVVAEYRGEVVEIGGPVGYGDPDFPGYDVVVQNFATTDFGHAALWGNRLAVPWHDRDTQTLSVSIVELPHST